MERSELVIWSPRPGSRGQDLRLAHRHDGRWIELTPGLPIMTPVGHGRRRRWRLLFRCSSCGRSVVILAPV